MTHLDEISALVQDCYGLVPHSRWSHELKAAIDALARANGVASEDTAQRILRSPSLLAKLVGALTVKESFFFRHAPHFEFIVTAARVVLQNPDLQYCVWSAGCATGEEPYSVAIALRDALPSNDLARVAISATDADGNAVAAATAGVYSRWAFRGVRSDIIDRHFRPQRDQRQQLNAEVLRQVKFRHASIQEHVAGLPSDSLDAIFFRNVSVYLTGQSVANLYREFSRVLRVGGHLFVAATDARPQSGEFRMALSQDTTIYERRVVTEQNTRLGAVSIRPSRRPWKARARARESTPPESVQNSARIQRMSHPHAADDWRVVDELADRGDLAGALALLSGRLAKGEETAQVYQRRGSIHLALGNFPAAIDDFRRVLYLDPEDTVARYWYALALRQAGRREAAHHQLCLVVAAAGTDNEVLRSSAQALIGELA